MFGAQVLQLKHSNTNKVVLQKMVNALCLRMDSGEAHQVVYHCNLASLTTVSTLKA